MDFIKNFQKDLTKINGIGLSSSPPRYWYSTGNYVLNYVISGEFSKGIPQGRITNFSGPSGAGKSFNVGNAAAEAQSRGAILLVIDSENALDDEFMTKLGVDVNNNYTYVSVTTIDQVQTIVSSFLKQYKKEFGGDPDAPEVFIAIDSLDMLMTETELSNYDSGKTKGDQGQRNKQLKAMLRGFVHDIASLNVVMVVTSQVYKNQDVTNGEGVWIISDAVKYSASQIILVTKLKLKDKTTNVVDGIRMKCEGYKTRFTKPFQTVTIEVPYERGIDKFSGFKEVAIQLGVLEQAGSRLRIAGTDTTFYERDLEQYEEILLQAATASLTADSFIEVSDAELDLSTETKAETRARRNQRAAAESSAEATE